MPARAHQAAGGSHLGLWCSYCRVSGHAEVSSWYKLGNSASPHQTAVDTALFQGVATAVSVDVLECHVGTTEGSRQGFKSQFTLFNCQILIKLLSPTLMPNPLPMLFVKILLQLWKILPDKVTSSHANTTGIAPASTSWAIDSGAGSHNAGTYSPYCV